MGIADVRPVWCENRGGKADYIPDPKAIKSMVIQDAKIVVEYRDTPVVNQTGNIVGWKKVYVNYKTEADLARDAKKRTVPTAKERIRIAMQKAREQGVELPQDMIDILEKSETKETDNPLECGCGFVGSDDKEYAKHKVKCKYEVEMARRINQTVT